MITLEIAYNDNSEKLVKELEDIMSSKYPLVDFHSYHENLFTERKKAFKLKGGYSARQCPFAVLLDDKKVISAFYNESKDCNLDKILEALNNYTLYDKKV